MLPVSNLVGKLILKWSMEGLHYTPGGMAQVCFSPGWKVLLAVSIVVFAAGASLVPRKWQRVSHRCYQARALAYQNSRKPDQKAYNPWVIFLDPEYKRAKYI